MSSKRVYILLLMCFICASSKAQVDKQVEVTKAYIPEIEPSEKLRLTPDMADTVRLRPEIDYSVTPRSMTTPLLTQPYKAAKVTYWEFNRPQRGYLKAGVGVPLSSLADVYLSNANPNTNYYVAYINHQGKYANLRNDYNEKLSATNTQNRVGGAAGLYLGDKILEGELYYDIDMWSRYATSDPIVAHPTYQTIAFAGRWGDDFVELSKWNYNVRLDASQFFSREDYNNTSLNFTTKFGGNLKKGKLITEVGYEYTGSNYNYMNNSALISTTYSFNTPKFDIDLGGEYIFDYVSTHTQRSQKNYVLPHIVIKKSSKVKLQPFVEFTGEIERNGYAELSRVNPYITEGLFLDRNSVNYSLRGGISGVLGSDKLQYNIFADYTITQDARYWALVEEEYDVDKIDNYYYAERANLQGLSVNANIEYQPLSGLVFDFGAVGTKWITSSNTDLCAARPSAKIYLGGEYSTKELRYGASAELEEVSYTSLITNSGMRAMQTAMTVNVKAFVDYTLKNGITLFCEMENIANAKLYEWMGYREYGVGGVVGIKMQF